MPRSLTKLSATAFLATALFAMSVSPVHAESVNCDSPGKDLQKAIDNAPAGSTLFISGNCSNGPYSVTTKDLTLTGGNTILSAPNGGGAVLTLRNHSFQVFGLTIDATGRDTGISIGRNASVNVSSVDVHGAARFGILITGSSHAFLFRNEIKNNGDGVTIFESADALIVENTIESNVVGIGVTLGGTANIGGNVIDDNDFGVAINANSSIFLNDNTITNNTIAGVLVKRSSFLGSGGAPNTIEDNGVVDVKCESRGMLEFASAQISLTKVDDIAADCLVFGTIF